MPTWEQLRATPTFRQKMADIETPEQLEALAAKHGNDFYALTDALGIRGGIFTGMMHRFLRSRGVTVSDLIGSHGKRVRGGESKKTKIKSAAAPTPARAAVISTKGLPVPDRPTKPPGKQNPYRVQEIPESSSPPPEPPKSYVDELSAGIMQATEVKEKPEQPEQMTTLDLFVAICRAKALGAAAQLVERIVELYPQFALELNAADYAFEELAKDVVLWPSSSNSSDSDSLGTARLLDFADRFRKVVHLIIPEDRPAGIRKGGHH